MSSLPPPSLEQETLAFRYSAGLGNGAVMTVTWPGLTPGLVLGTGAACSMSMPGPLAGQGICE